MRQTIDALFEALDWWILNRVDRFLGLASGRMI